ncbi:hypothetical protein PG997_015193 [Apiospora hydei]|uniref:Phytase-like domain-containing protein n=1 Tax=Apiospora hydei TaxID=1337664 RepID=A0ABR1UYG7_9PEZI
MLKLGQSVPDGAQMPGWLTYDSVSKNVYILVENQCSQATAFYISDIGSFELLGQARTDDGDVHGILYGGSDGGSFLAMAGYYTSFITTFELPLDQSSRGLLREHFRMSRPGPVKSRQDAPYPNAVVLDPTGRFLLVPDLGVDVIRNSSVDPDFGTLEDCRPAKTGDGDGPRHGTFYQTEGASTTRMG